MKKIIILTLLSIITIAGSIYADNHVAIPNPGDDLIINIRVVFHRPKFDCLRGFGICAFWNWQIEDTQLNDWDKFCPAKAYINDRNQLVVSVQEEYLNKYENGSTLPYFKDKTSISILDPFNIPDQTCKALGVVSPQAIKPGNYPVTYSDGIYTVIFQL